MVFDVTHGMSAVLRIAAAVLFTIAAASSGAQNTTFSEQPKAIKSPEAVTSLGPDLFGIRSTCTKAT